MGPSYIRSVLGALALLTQLSFLGCAHPEHKDFPLTGLTLKELESAFSGGRAASKKRPMVAIALGGGGLRGYAHLGVLEALEEMNVKPDIIVGTSIGSVVGSMYAAGLAPAKIWEKAVHTDICSLTDISWHGPALVKGEAISEWADTMVNHVPIEKFPMRFAAVAADLDRELAVVMTKGPVGQAIRASAAIPALLLPVPYDKGELVDGGVLSLVPVRAARALGADIVIGVDIYCNSPRFSSKSTLSTVLRVTQMQSCLLAQQEMEEADILISPSVSSVGIDDRGARENAWRMGYNAGKAAESRIMELIVHARDSELSSQGGKM